MTKPKPYGLGWRSHTDKPFGVRWPTSPIKITGIYFSYNVKLAYQLNMQGPLDSLKKCLQLWSSRSLTLIGKTQIIKSLMIPKFLYMFNLIVVKVEDIKQINNLLYKFVWKGPDKIARNSMIGDIGQGGINFLDIFALYDSFRVKWVQRFLNPNIVHPWKMFLSFYLRPLGGRLIFRCNYEIKYLPVALPQFYQSLLHSWSKSTTQVNTSSANIVIWNNAQILINGKSVCYLDFIAKGIVYIADLYIRKGHFKTWNVLNQLGLTQSHLLL